MNLSLCVSLCLDNGSQNEKNDMELQDSWMEIPDRWSDEHCQLPSSSSHHFSEVPRICVLRRSCTWKLTLSKRAVPMMSSTTVDKKLSAQNRAEDESKESTSKTEKIFLKG